MSTSTVVRVSFSPSLRSGDALADHWLGQVTLRLRREITWLRHARGDASGLFPALGDRLQFVLDLSRFGDEKQHYFRTDATAAWLTDQLQAAEPLRDAGAERGSFGWAADELALEGVSRFLLALGVAAAFDQAVGSAVGACLNLTAPAEPNLALAQHLWDEPAEVLAAADPGHPLFTHGLLQTGDSGRGRGSGVDWERPLRVAPLAARQLLFPDSPLPPVLEELDLGRAGAEAIGSEAALVGARLRAAGEGIRVVPVRGARGAAHDEVVAAVARWAGRTVARFRGDPALLREAAYLEGLATLCWLRGMDLFLDAECVALLLDEHRGGMEPFPSTAIPVAVFLGIHERRQVPRLPARHLLPILAVPEVSYGERVALWEQGLGPRGRRLGPAVAECARRFRFGKTTIARVCEGLAARPGPITAADLVAASRAEVDLDIGDLAERVTPRFQGERVLLPPAQARQFAEVMAAMTALTEVHYRWGTARAWNEGGITALFAGPPGTGKTMAAEVLAAELGLPMYRIDLSQVVDKYIGETEKNLKRLFDAADVSDVVLFFDEADSLFGRRTEVRDAHDRYANLEISYLLQRMERFKGLAVLATNRRRDLDEAFLRRLRFIIEFPIPDEERRREMWEQMVPAGVDVSEVDFGFLARQFALAGGHIRSIVLNACLQSAHRARSGDGAGDEKRLAMPELIAAVKREYDKLNRAVGPEHFGAYAPLVKEMMPRHEAS